jgi:hypothetical protein
MSQGLAELLGWDRELKGRKGAATRLAGIDVYHDFDWLDLFRDERTQFRNGQCLARRVLADCPEGKAPALLLTDRDEVEEGARTTGSHYVVVLNLPRYLELAEADAAVSYLARALGPGITRVRELQELAAARPDELRALMNLKLEAGDIAAWAAGNETRLAELRAIVESETPPGTDVATAVSALRALGHLDSEVVTAIVDLFGTDVGREIRLQLLRALTEDPSGRRVTGDVLGQRMAERLGDARRAVADYSALLDRPDSTETDLQAFLEINPWLLGLDYSRVLARQPILRGTADFILERFDGFHDLLELKSPQDPIIVAPDEGKMPPSASKQTLSRDLAQAIAQVHVYRDALRHEAVADESFGLSHSRDPHVIIVIGKVAALSDQRGRLLRELNRSLHHVEIVPYDILGKRSSAVLDNVDRYLLAVSEEQLAEASE